MRSRSAKIIHTPGDFKVKGATLIRYVGKASHVVVPSHVKRLAPRAFYDVKEIIIKGADTRIHSTAFCDLSVSDCSVYIPRGFRDEDILRNQRLEKINVKYLDEIPYNG
jgi:hypothetical protein